MARNVVSIKDVVNDFILGMAGDDYVSGTPDYVVHNLALRGVREMGFDLMKKLKSINLDVNKDNATVELPDDFVDFVRIGYGGSDGLFYSFKESKNLNTSMKYVVDSNGNPIDSNNDGVNDREDDKTGIANLGSNAENYPYVQYVYENTDGRQYGYGGARAEAQFRLNYEQNRIEISTDYMLDTVTIEYIADEARSQNPSVHIYCEEALRQYVYYRLVERKSDVPYNEKARARQEYFNELRRANARMNSFSKDEALFTIRKNFRQSPKF